MTYVFRCRSCGHEFEMTATVAEYESRKIPACPQCGREEARRVYTPILVMSAAGTQGEAGGGGGGGGGRRGGGASRGPKRTPPPARGGRRGGEHRRGPAGARGRRQRRRRGLRGR